MVSTALHLQLDPAGLETLRNRLQQANRDNPDFDAQYARLQGVLRTVLLRLQGRFEDRVERVLAVGDWAREGIDLRNLPYDEILLSIVLRSATRPFDLYWRFADEVFAGLPREEVVVQFRLETLPEWQHALALAQARGSMAALGVPLLSRG
jgi:hypothetical protein